METQGILPMQAGNWMLSMEGIKQAGVSAGKRAEQEGELRRKVSGQKLLQCAADQMQHRHTLLVWSIGLCRPSFDQLSWCTDLLKGVLSNRHHLARHRTNGGQTGKPAVLVVH